MVRDFALWCFVTASLFGFGLPALAAEPVNQSFFGKAIKGYDPVAYFTEQRPVKGSSEYSVEWSGSDWYFSSAENLASFVADPEQYAPQYGGFCSWAVSQGYTAGIDPDAWTIHQDKLYLNYSKSVQAKWLKNRDDNISKADNNWPQLVD